MESVVCDEIAGRVQCSDINGMMREGIEDVRRRFATKLSVAAIAAITTSEFSAPSCSLRIGLNGAVLSVIVID